MIPEDMPETPAELYDLLHSMYGIGNYDDLLSHTPWFRARITEIVKLKAMLGKRRCTPRQVAVAAWYAREQNRPITAAWQLFELIPEAQADYRAKAKRAHAAALALALDEAIQDAVFHQEFGWVDQLSRLNPAHAENTIAAFRKNLALKGIK